MLKVGLTGSIAVGKSFVLGILSELGCRVLDADATAREVVAPGSAGLQLVVDAFGHEVLRQNGTLDRATLGGIVFSNDEKRQLLNSILHPLIIATQDDQIRKWQCEDPHGIAVIDAALMIESGGYKRFDKLIVVYCDRETQIDRLMKRNQIAREDAERRLAAQMTSEEKLRYADYRVSTDGTFEATRQRVIEVFNQLSQSKQARKRTE